LKDYVKIKSNQISSEFVRKIQTWDQKRLDSLQERINSESTNRSTPENEIVSERIIMEKFKPEFNELITMVLTQCKTYIEIVDISKSIPNELKTRLKRIYLIMKKEAEIVKKNKKFQLKDNSFFLDFIKGSFTPEINRIVYLSECQQIFNLIKKLEPGCYPGMCGNKNIIKQIQVLTFNLEQKMFAFPLVFRLEGRNCVKEVIRTTVKHSVPGKKEF
jgi:hypothetical protein